MNPPMDVTRTRQLYAERCTGDDMPCMDSLQHDGDEGLDKGASSPEASTTDSETASVVSNSEVHLGDGHEGQEDAEGQVNGGGDGLGLHDDNQDMMSEMFAEERNTENFLRVLAVSSQFVASYVSFKLN